MISFLLHTNAWGRHHFKSDWRQVKQLALNQRLGSERTKLQIQVCLGLEPSSKSVSHCPGLGCQFSPPPRPSLLHQQIQGSWQEEQRRAKMKTPRSHIYPSLPGTEEMLHLDVLLEGRGASSMPWALRERDYLYSCKLQLGSFNVAQMTAERVIRCLRALGDSRKPSRNAREFMERSDDRRNGFGDREKLNPCR
nr:uncharacterized protein LOC123281782 isoform X2 [Equus asinus]